MESFYSLPRTELIGRKVHQSRDAARADAFDYIETFYNILRGHSTIGDPARHRDKAGKLYRPTVEKMGPDQFIHAINDNVGQVMVAGSESA